MPWFAIDQYRHVGVFFPGENGPLPRDAGGCDNFFTFVDHLLCSSPSVEDVQEVDWQPVEDTAAEAGLFLFEYRERWSGTISAYHWLCRPNDPRHVEFMPPAYRKACKQFRFETLDFRETDRIQILEHLPPDALVLPWEGCRAYEASDQKTIRPIPGREGEFAAFVHEFQRMNPEAKAVFDGPGVPPVPRKRKRGRKGG
jgi:hypothetical protein